MQTALFKHFGLGQFNAVADDRGFSQTVVL